MGLSVRESLAAALTLLGGRLVAEQIDVAIADSTIAPGRRYDYLDFLNHGAAPQQFAGRFWLEGRAFGYSPDGSAIRYFGPELNASYMIFIDAADGNKIKARNGATGQIEKSDTDAQVVLQHAMDNLPIPGAGSIFIKRGVYEIASADLDISRFCGYNGRLIIQGEGVPSNMAYHPLETGGTVLHFDAKNLKDRQAGVWRGNVAHLYLDDIGVVLTGDGSSNGRIATTTTLPIWNNVGIHIDGDYGSSPPIGACFGFASGPEGETAVFRNVSWSLLWATGSYMAAFRAHFDTFLWDGGTILTNFGPDVSGPVLCYGDNVATAKVSNISPFRSDSNVWIPFKGLTGDWIFENVSERQGGFDPVDQNGAIQTQAGASVALSNCELTVDVPSRVRCRIAAREAVTPITVGMTPFTHTNDSQTAVCEDVQVVGGTVSDIGFVRGGVETSLGVTSGIFRLDPGDGLKVTYTGTPTMRRISR